MPGSSDPCVARHRVPGRAPPRARRSLPATPPAAPATRSESAHARRSDRGGRLGRAGRRPRARREPSRGRRCRPRSGRPRSRGRVASAPVRPSCGSIRFRGSRSRENLRVATIDHVTLRTTDLDAALRLFTRSFELLAFGGTRSDGGGFHEWNDFSIAAADEGHPRTTGVHVGFAATSPAQVDHWWEEMTRAGHCDDGAPGPRPEYGSTYYGAFIRDPDDNSLEAVHHESADPGTGVIDHLWIRVAELAPAN